MIMDDGFFGFVQWSMSSTRITWYSRTTNRREYQLHAPSVYLLEIKLVRLFVQGLRGPVLELNDQFRLHLQGG